MNTDQIKGGAAGPNRWVLFPPFASNDGELPPHSRFQPAHPLLQHTLSVIMSGRRARKRRGKANGGTRESSPPAPVSPWPRPSEREIFLKSLFIEENYLAKRVSLLDLQREAKDGFETHVLRVKVRRLHLNCLPSSRQ